MKDSQVTLLDIEKRMLGAKLGLGAAIGKPRKI